MSNPALQSAADPLADLRPAYVLRLRNRIASLSVFVASVQHGTAAGEAMSENHRCVHSMISSAAIFGHLELSRDARAAEQAFEKFEEKGTSILIHQIEMLLISANQVLNAYEALGNSGEEKSRCQA